MRKANNVRKKHKASATNDENKEKPDAELAAQSTAQKAKVSVERLRNGRRGVFTKSQKPRSVHYILCKIELTISIILLIF